MDITDLPAHALSSAIVKRQVSCREVMRATLARIESVNPVHNAIVSLRDGDVLLREADQRDEQLQRGTAPAGPIGWMHGMPQAIKDMAQTAGIRTTLGSPLLRDFVPTEDGLMVQRMKAAGCIVIGKTNTPEFGLGSHTFNEVFGVTRNAYDATRSAGGSSGGAAVALALHMLPVADGSDFMGSLRNPAAWNNVFGFRPSQGRVPTWPLQDVWVSQLGTAGPMGRTVQDVAMLLEVQAGYDARVPLSLDGCERFALALDDFEIHKARVGWLGDLAGYLPMEPGILAACEQGLRRLQDLGCMVESVPHGFAPAQVWEAWLIWRRWLVAARIAPYLANSKNRALIKPEALWEHDQASNLSAAQVLSASDRRSAFYQQMLALFDRCDFLALPAAQVWPFDAALRWPKEIAGREMDTYHRWMEVVVGGSLAGVPVLNVPAGFGPGGLPIGLQVMGRAQADLAVLQVGHAYEQASSYTAKRSPLLAGA
jgi:amidase